jgi:hypothetical protein
MPPPVVIVNKALVRTFWKDVNPIGQTLKPGLAPFAQVPDFTVIGVARDVKQGGVDHRTGTELYTLIDQTARFPAPLTSAPGSLNIVLRTTLLAATLRTSIEAIVREADPSVPIVRLRDMSGVFEESIERPRLLAQLIGGFGAVAQLLAATGTYGVLTCMVAGRRREMGIRFALGADRRHVIAAIMRQGLGLTAVGIVAGLAGAFALNACSLPAVRSPADRSGDPGGCDRDHHRRRRRCLLAARLARITGRSRHRPARLTGASLGRNSSRLEAGERRPAGHAHASQPLPTGSSGTCQAR